MTPLSNKTALITGATKGMGAAIAEKLAQNGYNLLLCARDTHALNRVKHQLEQTYPAIYVTTYPVDFSQKQQVHDLAEQVAAQKDAIDILVNNVGIYRPASVLDETAEDYEVQMQVNYYTTYHLCQAIGRAMRKNRSGHIFNISSIASRSPVATAGTYTVTKYAIRGLTQVLRDELRPYGVRVTEIIPGSTLTSSWEGTTIPADRFVLPEDIAQAILTCLRVSEGANVDELVVTPRYGNI